METADWPRLAGSQWLPGIAEGSRRLAERGRPMEKGKMLIAVNVITLATTPRLASPSF